MLYTANQASNSAHDEMMRTQFANTVSIKKLKHLQLQGKTLLDPGCGVSTSLPQMLHKEGASYHLLDYKESTVNTMREALSALGLPCDVSQGNIMALEFGDGSFDYVHERLVLMHVSNPAQGIRECLRVAKEYAFFIGIDWSTFEWKEGWVGDFYKEAVGFVESRGSDMSFGGKITKMLPEGTNYTVETHHRPWGDHAYIVSSLCETLIGMNPDERLRKFLMEISRTALCEGAWVKPALMNVVTVKKESEPIRDGLAMGAL